MSSVPSSVEQHYGLGRIMDAILSGLAKAGKDLTRLTPADLAPVDEFHIRGRESTMELARLGALCPGLRVLDVGSGLGGSARYLAVEQQCQVTGIDLTREYVDAANRLADLVGVGDKVSFQQASALDMPFDDASFDVAWTEHVQMNIADKRAFYTEIRRVLKPGGVLLFHDIFQGEGGPLYFPAPWADDPSISFLATPQEARQIVEDVGFVIHDWHDKTQPSLDWFVAIVEKLKASGPPPLGLHLLMGDTAKTKFENNIRNLRERRFVVFQARAQKE